MVTINERDDTVVRVSRWLDVEVEKYISSSKKNKIEFPSKRNFVDFAVLKLLESKGVRGVKGGRKE